MYLTLCIFFSFMFVFYNNSAVKDMASNLENRWRSLVKPVDKSSLENGVKRVDGIKNAEGKFSFFVIETN